MREHGIRCKKAYRSDLLRLLVQDSEGNNVLEQDSLREAMPSMMFFLARDVWARPQLAPPSCLRHTTGTHSFSDISKPDMSPADAEATADFIFIM